MRLPVFGESRHGMHVANPALYPANRLLFHTNRTGDKIAPQRRRKGMVALYEKQRRRLLR